MRHLFSYDDIVLRPKYSELVSRDDADTSTTFLGKEFRLPVVPANMEDVISYENARYLSERNYFYIMHRFKGMTNSFMESYLHYPHRILSISVGVNGESKQEIDVPVEPDFVTIDVAHAHHSNVKDMVNFLRGSSKYHKAKIIAGNVATADGYKYLCDLGVDAVKVGIGGGMICTTKFETGFHLPTAYSVWECAQTGLDVPIIADGGIKHRGDIAKALVLGADMVMCGGLFAQCIDSPAKIVHGKKIYRGSTSYEAKGNNNHVEGKTIEIDEGITYEQQLQKIHQSLSSSISYAGGKDLSAFRSVEWELI
jgi:GMP reductase